MLGKRSKTLGDIKPIKRRAPKTRVHGRTHIDQRRRAAASSSKIKRYVLWSFAILVVLSSYYILFWSPLFKITEPIIVGTQKVDSSVVREVTLSDLRGLSWGIFPKDVLFVSNPKKITSDILEVSGALLDAKVRKELPNILKINIEERQPQAIWSAGGQFFFVDERGIAYNKILRKESKDAGIKVVVDEHNKPTLQGDRVITKVTLDFVKSIDETFNSLGDLSVNFYIAPSRLAPDLTMITSQGWKVIFDTTADPSIQISTLQKVIKKESNDKNGLQYIDLRIPGRVFIK